MFLIQILEQMDNVLLLDGRSILGIVEKNLEKENVVKELDKRTQLENNDI